MDAGIRRAVLGQKEQPCSLQSRRIEPRPRLGRGDGAQAFPFVGEALCTVRGLLRAISIVIPALGGSGLPSTKGIQA